MCNFKLCMMMIKYFLDFYFFKAFFLQKLDIVAELLRLLLLFSFGQSVLKMEMLRHEQDIFEKISLYSTMPTVSVLVYDEPKVCWCGRIPAKKESNIV